MMEISRPCLHHSARPVGVPIDCIVIHDTGAWSAQSTIGWFADPSSKVSSHVLIARDGSIFRFVLDDRKAWHAGASSLHGRPNVNDFSLGVELVDADDNKHPAGYTDLQLDAAARWCAAKVREYGIPINRIVGHDMIAPERKSDPGRDFPWRPWLLTVAKLVIA